MGPGPKLNIFPKNPTEHKTAAQPVIIQSAQEDPIAPGALMELTKRTPETAEAHKKIVIGGLAKYGAVYDESITLNENIRRLKILKILESKGIIQVDNGQIIFDPTKINEWQKRSREKYDRDFSVADAFYALRGLRGFNREELEKDKTENKENTPLRDIIADPISIKELPEFAEQSRNSIINIWDLEKKFHYWGTKIKTQSGEEVTLSELRLVAAIFGDLKAKRDQEGRLIVYDSKRNEWRLFSSNLFLELTKITMTAPDMNNDRRISFHSNPMVFINKYSPNLLKTGLLQPTDFRVRRGTSTSELFDIEKRRLNPAQPYVVFRGNGGHSARYYLGRNKIVGTEIPVTGDTFTIELDPETGGVIENRLGTPRLLCTIKLFKQNEVQKKREEARQKYIARKHKEPLPQELTALTLFGGSEVRERIKEYDITNYLPQRDGELAADYARRVNRLQNVGFVAQTSRDFFSEANVGIHNFPWSEQLILANAIFEAPSPEKLKEFVRQYGRNGIRTFLSMDYDPKMAGMILKLGEKFPEAAKIIFEKYNEIIDLSKEVEDFILRIFGGAATESTLKIKESLFRRAKDLLTSYKDKINSEEAIDLTKISLELENIKGEILLFASTFKVLSEKEHIKLTDLEGAHFEIKDSSLLTDEEKQVMTRIFIENRPGYSPELLKKTLEEFTEALESRNHEFHVLHFNDEIIAFLRFDRLPNGNLYAGSLNVRTEIRGSAIGSAMLHATLDKKAEEYTIEAVVYEKNPMLHRYIEDYGFEIVGEIENYHGTGQKFFKIEIKKRIKKNQEPTSSTSAISQAA